MFARIPVIVCYTFSACTNTFLLPVVHHGLQCWEGMSQERTSLTYVSRSSRGTVEYIIRPRLLFSESYHMNSECMLSSEKVFLKTLKIKTIGIPPKKLCKFLQSRRTAEVGGFSPSSQSTWAPHGPRFVPAPCPPLFLLPL